MAVSLWAVAPPSNRAHYNRYTRKRRRNKRWRRRGYNTTDRVAGRVVIGDGGKLSSITNTVARRLTEAQEKCGNVSSGTNAIGAVTLHRPVLPRKPTEEDSLADQGRLTGNGCEDK